MNESRMILVIGAWIACTIGFAIGRATCPDVEPAAIYPAAAPVPPISENAAWRVPCMVERVIDADTFQCRVDLGRGLSAAWRIRVVGIDAPERNTPEGKTAIVAAKAFAAGKRGQILFDVDREDSFGRVLADVEIDGVRWSRHMLSTGNAKPYDGR